MKSLLILLSLVSLNLFAVEDATEEATAETTAAPMTAEKIAEVVAEAIAKSRPTVATASYAAPEKKNGTGLSVNFDSGDTREGMSNAVKILLLITILAIAPAFVMMMTCFPRIIIVFGFLRKALGTQTLPPNQVVLGLSLFLTLFIMKPVITKIYDDAYDPYMKEEITETVALKNGENVIRSFLAKHTRDNDLILFIKISGTERPETVADVPFLVLVPAFVTSELKTAFQMGFVLFLPFLIIDLVIAAVLMALGMMMLPPVIVSLPFKILLFVMVDGWGLIVGSLVNSYW